MVTDLSIAGRFEGLIHQFSAPLEYVTLLVTILVLLLGAYIGYQAFRGYRRNNNRPVLFLGLGVFLVTTGRQVSSTIAYLLVGENSLVLLVVFFTISIAGLLSVLYAFLWA